jgi:enhancing lycopene biosynthesis protein 2
MTSLPELVDRKTVAAETNLPRSAIDAIWRQLDVFNFEGGRKVYARRTDVLAVIEASRINRGAVRPYRRQPGSA